MKNIINQIRNLFGILFFGCFIVALTGCNTTSYVETSKDGSSKSIQNHRFLWASDSFAAQFGPNGASLTANKSSADSATISAIVQGAVAGAGQAAKTP